MRTKLLAILSFSLGSLAARQASAAIAFPDPPTGWTYQFNGDQLNTTNGTPAGVSLYPQGTGVSLDGTWRYTGGGSDSFDGSTNGGTFVNGGFGVGNKPGGWTLCNEGGVTFVRMQDPGDPRVSAAKYTDPSNRKLMMGRFMDLYDFAAIDQLSQGFTMCFRARVPTPGNTTFPIDPLYPASAAVGPPGPQPYPPGGDGYVTFNGGKGNIMVHEGVGDPTGGGVMRGASIAFSLTQTNDNNGSSSNVTGFAGLTMNELNGNLTSDNVDFGQGSSTNKFTCDPTQWHEFWIVIKKDPSGIGTHEAYIFMDGNLTPQLFHMTAGGSQGQADFGNTVTYICIASPSTGQSCALDVDFLAYKLGEEYPAGAINILPPAVVSVRPFTGQPFYATSSNLVVQAITFGTNNIPTTGAQLILNGADVSGGLTPSGTAQDRTFTYASLVPNTIYNGQMIVSDQAGRTVTNAFAFDTLLESSTTIIESEDYNYNTGQSINNPAAGAYSGLTGTYRVDYVDDSQFSVGVYRAGDGVDTDVTPDFPRPKFINSAQTDYDISGIARGEWCNYTRTLSAGRYKAYLRAAATVAQDVRLDLVTSSPALPNQTVKFLGTFHVPKTGGLNTFANVPLNDMLGTQLPLALSGTTTLRVTAVSANNDLALNYLVLAQAGVPTAPVVATAPAPSETGVLPDASVEAAIYDGSSPVDVNSVVLTVNGSAVTPTKVKSGSTTLVKYSPSSLWPILSSNFVNLAFNDGTARSASWGFTVAFMPSLTPAMKVTDATTPGFFFRVFQNGDDNAPSTTRAELQLAGQSTFTNRADPFAQGPADAPGEVGANPDFDPLTFHIPSVIDLSQGNATYGNFVNPGSGADDLMPGIPGVGGPGSGKDGIGAEFKTFISLPAGVVTMVLNSDDGMKLTSGFTNSPLVLTDVEGQFGDADVVVRFIVQQAGVYPFRMVWFQSDHGFAIEWAVLNSDGSLILVNDLDNSGPAAFQTGTGQAAPSVTLQIQNVGGGNVKLTWGAIGTLQSATSVRGPYSDIPTASSPYTTSVNASTYFRVRIPQ